MQATDSSSTCQNRRLTPRAEDACPGVREGLTRGMVSPQSLIQCPSSGQVSLEGERTPRMGDDLAQSSDAERLATRGHRMHGCWGDGASLEGVNQRQRHAQLGGQLGTEVCLHKASLSPEGQRRPFAETTGLSDFSLELLNSLRFGEKKGSLAKTGKKKSARRSQERRAGREGHPLPGW